jgi:hypothetical protein
MIYKVGARQTAAQPIKATPHVVPMTAITQGIQSAGHQPTEAQAEAEK